MTALSKCVIKTSIHELYYKIALKNGNETSALKFAALLRKLLERGFVDIVYNYDGKVFWKISERGKHTIAK